MKIIEKKVPPQHYSLSSLKLGELFISASDKSKTLYMVVNTRMARLLGEINKSHNQCLVVSLGSLNSENDSSDKHQVWIYSDMNVIKYKLSQPLSVELDS